MNMALPQSCQERAARAAAVAANHAGEVDRDARFPHEAFDAIRAEGLLSILIPTDLGGGGMSYAETAAICSTLAGACGSTGLIYAMHQIQVASLLNSSLAGDWHRTLLARISSQQLLLASATTEGGIGGDIRSSSCAVRDQDGRISIEKSGTVISYARAADVILATARRNADAPSSDQVLVCLMKEDCELSQTAPWNTLGMRGTVSEGFDLVGRAMAAQVCLKPFGEIAAQSMMPTSHIFWSAVWHGIAADAFLKAQSLVRSRARSSPGGTVPGAQRLAMASARLQLLRANIREALSKFAGALAEPESADRTSFAIVMSTLKISSGELAIEVVQHALQICGIGGFRNEGPQSLSRHLRDAYSSLVMINNDRIENTVATLLSASRHDARLIP